ncbi:MAG: exonuclease SbcCD subunit D [Mogibacterium sp.]|nr:exonuclease SbcCD subunit D [Mogibacterium sp.]
MRIIHLGDLHLGKTLGEYSLIRDQEYILNQILDIVKEKDVNAVLIAGDVYDRSLPSEAAVNLLDSFLSKLAAMCIKTYIISGNHDSEDRLEYGSRLFSSRGIHITSKFNGELVKATTEDEFGELNIYMLPFIKASRVRYYCNDNSIETYEDAVRTVIEQADVDWSERNILIAHQFVTGDSSPQIAGSEGASVQNVGLVEQISSEIFKDFDYVALGHLHSPQSVGYDHIRYSGSVLKYSLNEAFSSKSVPLINIGEKGSVEIELLRLSPFRDLRHITGKLNQILKEENIVDPDDYIYVTLTDEEIINDVMGIVQQYYLNTVKIDYQNSHTKEIENFDIGDIVSDKSFEEIISDFYLKMYGVDISDEELDVMMSVAREAGVINEAD